MKKGLVMEGGALRGMFTAGVLDVFMENNIAFDGAVGVSAGAVFGCNFKSRQIGRAIRYNMEYCNDKRYAGWGSWFRTGNFYNVQFDYEEIPKRLDIFDTDAYKKNPMEFYVVVTDAVRGIPVYKKLMEGDDRDILWMRASASMPMLSRMVHIDGGKYCDGGTSDSIPLRFFEKIGYEKNVVITTQPKGYVKEKNSLMPLLKIGCLKYPKLIGALKTRHTMYNEQIAYIEKAEKEKRAFVIRPPEALEIGVGERNKAELWRVYQIGRREGMRVLSEVVSFLEA